MSGGGQTGVVGLPGSPSAVGQRKWALASSYSESLIIPWSRISPSTSMRRSSATNRFSRGAKRVGDGMIATRAAASEALRSLTSLRKYDWAAAAAP